MINPATLPELANAVSMATLEQGKKSEMNSASLDPMPQFGTAHLRGAGRRAVFEFRIVAG